MEKGLGCLVLGLFLCSKINPISLQCYFLLGTFFKNSPAVLKEQIKKMEEGIEELESR
jgi:hypothetical protein